MQIADQSLGAVPKDQRYVRITIEAGDARETENVYAIAQRNKQQDMTQYADWLGDELPILIVKASR